MFVGACCFIVELPVPVSPPALARHPEITDLLLLENVSRIGALAAASLVVMRWSGLSMAVTRVPEVEAVTTSPPPCEPVQKTGTAKR